MEKLLASMNCENCSEFITDLRVSSLGRLQKKVGGGWQDASGDGGDTTVINNQNNIAEEMYPPPAIDTSLSSVARACNIASGLSEWMYEKFNDALDIVDAVADSIAAADAIFIIFPPAYFIANTSTSVYNEIVEATTSVLRAAFSTDEKDNLLCAIYCFLKGAGAVSGANVEALKDEIQGAFDDFALQVAFNIMFIEGLENAALIHRAMLYQSAGTAINCDALCVDCPGVTYAVMQAFDIQTNENVTTTDLGSGYYQASSVANHSLGWRRADNPEFATTKCYNMTEMEVVSGALTFNQRWNCGSVSANCAGNPATTNCWLNTGWKLIFGAVAPFTQKVRALHVP
jgi:hypothetical protein